MILIPQALGARLGEGDEGEAMADLQMLLLKVRVEDSGFRVWGSGCRVREKDVADLEMLLLKVRV
jgi:hypothetical protein